MNLQAHSCAILGSLGALAALRTLHIRLTEASPPLWTGSQHQGLAALSACVSLSQLSLHAFRVGPGAWTALAGLPALQLLELSACEGGTNADGTSSCCAMHTWVKPDGSVKSRPPNGSVLVRSLR